MHHSSNAAGLKLAASRLLHPQVRIIEKRRLVVCLSLLLLSIGAIHAQDRSSPDVAALSGRWDGMMSLLQRGECKAGRTGRQDYHVRLVIKIAADGSFEADHYVGPDERTSNRWTGRVNTDMTLVAHEPMTAVCGDQQSNGAVEHARRKDATEYVGRVIQKGKKLELTLEGDHSPCPQWGCTFRKRIRLSKKAG